MFFIEKKKTLLNIIVFYDIFRQEAPPKLKTSNGAIDCENKKIDCPLSHLSLKLADVPSKNMKGILA